jgi:hypothetical protein
MLNKFLFFIFYHHTELAWAKNLDSKLSLKYEKPRSRLLEKMGGKIIDE